MKTTQETADDGSITVSLEHKGVTLTRTISPVTDEDGIIDENATALQVENVTRAVEVKIDMGIITADSEMMQNVGAEPLPTPPAYSPIVKNKPEA